MRLWRDLIGYSADLWWIRRVRLRAGGPVVGSVFTGSALGARIGASATKLVSEDDIKGYFAAIPLAGNFSVGTRELSNLFGIAVFEIVSIALIFGATIIVSMAVMLTAVCALWQLYVLVIGRVKVVYHRLRSRRQQSSASV